MVTDTGGVNDKSFNQSSYAGVTAAAAVDPSITPQVLPVARDPCRMRRIQSEHEPVHVLTELKREMGPIAFSAQYQQSPIPPGGTIIKRKWLTPYDD